MVLHNGPERETELLGILQKAEQVLLPVIAQAGVVNKASFEIEKDGRGDFEGAVISLNVDGRTLRLRLEIEAASHRDFRYAALMIPQRISEFRKHAKRFHERMETLRIKVQERIVRAGHGMRLISFDMEPLDVRQAFHWNEQCLEARVETLDPTLKPAIVPLRSYTYRRFAASVALLERRQRGRSAMATQLAKQGAVLEVGPLTEALIARPSQTLPSVAA